MYTHYIYHIDIVLNTCTFYINYIHMHIHDIKFALKTCNPLHKYSMQFTALYTYIVQCTIKD